MNAISKWSNDEYLGEVLLEETVGVQSVISTTRSSRSQVSCKIVALKNSVKFTRKTVRKAQ